MYLSFHRSLALRSNCCFQHVYKLFRFKVRSYMIVHQNGVSSTQVSLISEEPSNCWHRIPSKRSERSQYSLLHLQKFVERKVRHCEGLEYFLISLEGKSFPCRRPAFASWFIRTCTFATRWKQNWNCRSQRINEPGQITGRLFHSQFFLVFTLL